MFVGVKSVLPILYKHWQDLSIMAAKSVKNGVIKAR